MDRAGPCCIILLNHNFIKSKRVERFPSVTTALYYSVDHSFIKSYVSLWFEPQILISDPSSSIMPSFVKLLIISLLLNAVKQYDCVLIGGGDLLVLNSWSDVSLSNLPILIHHRIDGFNPPMLTALPYSKPLLGLETPVKDRTYDLSPFLAGFVGGAASRAAKEVILHPIDTIRFVSI